MPVLTFDTNDPLVWSALENQGINVLELESALLAAAEEIKHYREEMEKEED